MPLLSPLATLLLRHADGSSATASRLGVLATDTEAPVVTETTVGPDLLQALEIITELRVDTVGKNLRVLAVDNILLSVQEPRRDLVLSRVLHDCDDALQLLRRKFTSTLVEVDVGLLQDQVGVSSANTLDLGEGKHRLLLSINIGVEETQDELEVRLLSCYERHFSAVVVYGGANLWRYKLRR